MIFCSLSTINAIFNKGFDCYRLPYNSNAILTYLTHHWKMKFEKKLSPRQLKFLVRRGPLTILFNPKHFLPNTPEESIWIGSIKMPMIVYMILNWIYLVTYINLLNSLFNWHLTSLERWSVLASFHFLFKYLYETVFIFAYQ